MNEQLDIDNLENKLANLRDSLQKMGSVLVAFSGGVDSTFLLKAAREALPEKVLAVTVLSQLTPWQERQDATEMAGLIGTEHLVLEADDLSDPVFTANPKDRCYHCKKKRFGMLKELAASRGLACVADGTNRDDFNDYRPGLKAVRELGIHSPLSAAGFGKQEIRQASRQLGLPTWDKPALACLASRVPYGNAITAEKLRQIDEGETFLRRLGICRQVRVRHHGEVARLEVAPQSFSRFMEADVRDLITEFFTKIGFQFVALDLEGYAMGSLNREILRKEGNPNG